VQQEFSADMNSRGVKRIEDVVRLRTAQFMEDGGPMAHPIRPDSYIKMDNFYTLTVYEKGKPAFHNLSTAPSDLRLLATRVPKQRCQAWGA
jgi:aminopeptidase N